MPAPTIGIGIATCADIGIGSIATKRRPFRTIVVLGGHLRADVG
jgi:hypothetical protein